MSVMLSIIARFRNIRPLTHEEHVERMTIIICVTVVLILLIIFAWRKMR